MRAALRRYAVASGLGRRCISTPHRPPHDDGPALPSNRPMAASGTVAPLDLAYRLPYACDGPSYRFPDQGGGHPTGSMEKVSGWSLESCARFFKSLEKSLTREFESEKNFLSACASKGDYCKPHDFVVQDFCRAYCRLLFWVRNAERTVDFEL